ncbi:MAG: flagellar hook-length control protein FliK [Zetaproteobacteria bacterium]|nr:MAG: flagellar hook-length control protein FliK [Zetaproteobacteria bacterium]
MMESQSIATISGAVAGTGASGVTRTGKESLQGGLFAVLMQLFAARMEGGAAADGKAAGLLSALLHGGHGAELAALIDKVARGTARSSDLAALSAGALTELRRALQLGDGADGTALLAGLRRLVAEAKGVDAKSAEAKAAEAKGIEAKGVDAKSAEAKAAEAKGIEAKGIDAKAAEAKGIEAKGVDAKSAEAKVAEAKSGGRTDDGSSLAVAVVAAGIRMEQHSRPTTGGSEQMSGGEAQAGVDRSGAKRVRRVAAAAGRDAGRGPAASAGGVASKGRSGSAHTEGASAPQRREVAGDTPPQRHRRATTDRSAEAGAPADARRAAGGRVVWIDRQAHSAAYGKGDPSVAQGTSATAQVATGADRALEMGGHHALDPAVSSTGDKRGQKAAVAAAAQTDGGTVQDDGAPALMRLTMPTAQGAPSGEGMAAADKALHPLHGGRGVGQHGAGDQGGRQGQYHPSGGMDGGLAGARGDLPPAARGGEFSAHLAYRAHASTWRPAEAMMQIGRAAGDGAMRIDLQLEPAHLGKVHVAIQSDGARQVQLHITVDSAAGRLALDQNMGQLRAALAQQGLDLGGLSMELSSQGQQGGQQQERGTGGFGRMQRHAFRIVDEGVLVEPGGAAGFHRDTSGRLSVLA